MDDIDGIPKNYRETQLKISKVLLKEIQDLEDKLDLERDIFNISSLYEPATENRKYYNPEVSNELIKLYKRFERSRQFFNRLKWRGDDEKGQNCGKLIAPNWFVVLKCYHVYCFNCLYIKVSCKCPIVKKSLKENQAKGILKFGLNIQKMRKLMRKWLKIWYQNG